DWQRKKWNRFAAAILRLGEQATVELPDATMVLSHSLQDHYQVRHEAKAFYVANGATLRGRHPAAEILRWAVEPANYILFLGRFFPGKELSSADRGLQAHRDKREAGACRRWESHGRLCRKPPQACA